MKQFQVGHHQSSLQNHCPPTNPGHGQATPAQQLVTCSCSGSCELSNANFSSQRAVSMRTMIALAALAIAPQVPSASAQSYAMDRGVWTVGGSASLTHYASGLGNGTTSISLFPSVGYFFLPGFLVAATLQYAHSSGSEFAPTSTAFGAGPRLAYYFGSGSARIHPYLAAAAFIGSERQRIQGSTSSVGVWSWRGAGGIALLLARNVAVTGEAFYGQTRSDVPDAATGRISSRASASFGLSFGLSLFL